MRGRGKHAGANRVEERIGPAPVEAKPSTVEAKPSTVEAKPSTVEAKPSTVEAKPPTRPGCPARLGADSLEIE